MKLKISKDSAYIIGALRDGTFTSNLKYYIYRIRIYQKNRDWIEKLSEKMYRTFSKKPTIIQDKRNGSWILRLNSRKIYEKIKDLAEYPGSQDKWSTPSKILNSPLEIQKEYIKGFFDSEGGVSRVDKKSFKPKDIKIYFCQANKKSLQELRQMIQRFKIHTGKICGPYFKKGYNKPVYGFSIHGIKEVINFYRTIGSLHEEKIKRFQIIENLS